MNRARLDWAYLAHQLIHRNLERTSGQERRHSLAAAAVYALLELAEAIREMGTVAPTAAEEGSTE